MPSLGIEQPHVARPPSATGSVLHHPPIFGILSTLVVKEKRKNGSSTAVHLPREQRDDYHM